jgi:hypothetical protein
MSGVPSFPFPPSTCKKHSILAHSPAAFAQKRETAAEAAVSFTVG